MTDKHERAIVLNRLNLDVIESFTASTTRGHSAPVRCCCSQLLPIHQVFGIPVDDFARLTGKDTPEDTKQDTSATTQDRKANNSPGGDSQHNGDAIQLGVLRTPEKSNGHPSTPPRSSELVGMRAAISPSNSKVSMLSPKMVSPATRPNGRNIVLTLSPDEGDARDVSTLFTGSEDRTIKHWDVETGECVRTFHGHESTVLCIHVAMVGIRQSGKNSGSLSSTGSALRQTSNRSTMYLEQMPFLFSGSDDHTIRMWQISTGECVSVFHGHTGPVTSILVQQGGRRLYSSSMDGTVREWDLISNRCLRAVVDASPTPILSMTEVPRSALPSKNSRRSSIDNGISTLSDSANAHARARLRMQKTRSIGTIRPPIVAVGLGSPSKLGTVAYVVDMKTGKKLRSLRLHLDDTQAHRASKSHDSESMPVQIDEKHEYDAPLEPDETGGTTTGDTADGINDSVDEGQNEGDGRSDAGLSAHSGVDLHRVTVPVGISSMCVIDGSLYAGFVPARTANGARAALAPDMAEPEQGIGEWDLQSSKYRRTLAHDRPTTCVTEWNGSLFSAHEDDTNTALRWNVQSGERIAAFYGHTQPVCDITIDPFARRLFSASYDQSARCYELETNAADFLDNPSASMRYRSVHWRENIGFVVSMFVLYTQLLAFSFYDEFPWSSDVAQPAQDVLPLVHLDDVFTTSVDTYRGYFAAMCTVMFTCTMLVGFDVHNIVSTLVATRRMMRDNGIGTRALARLRQFIWWFLWGMSDFFVIPSLTAVIHIWDCSEDAQGTSQWDLFSTEVVCFQGRHLTEVIIGTLIALMYLPVMLRLAVADGDARLVQAPDHASAIDRFKYVMLHNWFVHTEAPVRAGVTLPASRATRGKSQLSVAGLKMLMALLVVLLNDHIKVLSCLFVVAGVVLVVLSVVVRRFRDYRLNSIAFAANVTILSSFVLATVVVFVDDTDVDWPAYILWLHFLPVFVAVYFASKKWIFLPLQHADFVRGLVVDTSLTPKSIASAVPDTDADTPQPVELTERNGARDNENSSSARPVTGSESSLLQ
jgi:WD40 repeat protein